MTLTKSDIIKKINAKTGQTKRQSKYVAEKMIEIIKATLESNENILVSGFGKFSVRKKNERRGRNPATQTEMMLPTRRVVLFRYSRKLKDQINRKL